MVLKAVIWVHNDKISQMVLKGVNLWFLAEIHSFHKSHGFWKKIHSFWLKSAVFMKTTDFRKKIHGFWLKTADLNLQFLSKNHGFHENHGF